MSSSPQHILNKDPFVIRLIFFFAIKLTCCTTKNVGFGEMHCLSDHTNISYIDIKKRFTRTFYDFSLRQLKFQDFKYASRICDLELRFVVEQIEHVEHFELNRFKDTDSHEYFFVRRVMVVFICQINELLDFKECRLHFNKYRNKLKTIFTYFPNQKD